MNLKNNQITVAELLDNPASNAVFQRRFHRLMRHPLVSAARTLTLAQVCEMARVYLPQKAIEDTLEELKKL